MADKPEEFALDAEIAGMLGSALQAPRLAAPLRERLRERVLERAAGIHVVRAEAGTWVTLMPGISIKRLHQDREAGSETNLWRLSAGAIIPEHDHRSDEECLVVEGSILQGTLRAL